MSDVTPEADPEQVQGDQVVDDQAAANAAEPLAADQPAAAGNPSPDAGFVGHTPTSAAPVADGEPIVQPVHPSDTTEVEARAAAAPEVEEEVIEETETVTVTEEVTEEVEEPAPDAGSDPSQPSE